MNGAVILRYFFILFICKLYICICVSYILLFDNVILCAILISIRSNNQSRFCQILFRRLLISWEYSVLDRKKTAEICLRKNILTKIAPSWENWANLANPHPHVFSQLTLLSLIRSTNLADPHPHTLSFEGVDQLDWLIVESS